MKFGVWFYGIGTALAGILDIAWGTLDPSHQPVKSLGTNLPGQNIVAYVAGVWLVAAGLAVLWRRSTREGAAASAIAYLSFALFGYRGTIPEFMRLAGALTSWEAFLSGSLNSSCWLPRQHSFTPSPPHRIPCGKRELLLLDVGCWDCPLSSSA